MLKRKKFVESQIGKVDKQLDKLQTIIADVEQAQLNNIVLESLEKGRDALQAINQVRDMVKDIVDQQKILII